MNWELFKEAFLKEYYPKSKRLKRQQEFVHLVHGGLIVEKYNREFKRLNRFAPSMVDTKEKMIEKFVLVWNQESAACWRRSTQRPMRKP